MLIKLKKEECTGCEACVNICPKQCIHMVQNEEGFYYPKIDKKNCISCGKCEQVCYKKVKKQKNITKKTYAAYSKNTNTQKVSSSGGVFSELSYQILKNGGVVYGAAYEDDLTVCHIRITSETELCRIRGSKYVQSLIGDTYKKVLKDLSEEKDVLFSGTPCQIDGLYRFLGKDYSTLVTCAVICHGVPSPLIFSRYVEYQQGRIGTKIKAIDFRNKELEGWKTFYLKFLYKDFEEYWGHNEDLYFRGFLENLYLRKSCYRCSGKWKSDMADIVLGDFWGIDNTDLKINSYYGVNAVVVNSVKGMEIINAIWNECNFIETKYNEILKNNSSMEYPSVYNSKRNKFYIQLNETKDIYAAIKDNLKWQPTKENKALQLYPIISKYLEKILDGYSVSDYLKKQKKKNIVLYANTELMEYCLKDISREESIDIFLSDLNYVQIKKKYNNKKVLLKEEIIDKYKKGEIDCILVCSLSFENLIMEDFILKGISNDDIFSLVEYIFA